MNNLSLDMLDRKILYELDLNSRQPFKKLAKTLRISKETARFRVLRLIEKEYIKNFMTTINISKLNMFYYKIFYKFHKTTTEKDKEIIIWIKNYKGVAYFASLEGRYDITFLILARDTEDLYSFLVPFKEKFGEYILEQEILTMPSVHRFNFRFFYEKGKEHHTQYPLKRSQPNIDDIDYEILKQIAKNSRISLIQLAEITKTETNVVKYRIKKLRKKEIIGTHVLDLNFEKFNIQHFQICFILRNHSTINSMIRHALQNSKSTFATITLGKYDLALEFAVENFKEMREILSTIKTKFSQDIIAHDIFILEQHNINWLPQKEA